MKGSSLLQHRAVRTRSDQNRVIQIPEAADLQSQSILKTPPSILAFIPAGRTQWIGEPS